MFLFPPAGLLAMFNSFLVGRRYQMGDPVGSAVASYRARALCISTVVVVLVTAVILSALGIKS